MLGMAAKGHEGQKVLVIDDDPVMHRLFTNILQHVGYEVLLAGTGEQGLQMALERIPQLIILDYVMPDMDGLGTLKQLKAREETSRIPVLIATGYLDAASNQQFLDAGATACTAKPFEPLSLVALVERLVPGTTPSVGPAMMEDPAGPKAA